MMRQGSSLADRIPTTSKSEGGTMSGRRQAEELVSPPPSPTRASLNLLESLAWCASLNLMSAHAV
jgi:hypothetical protein